MKKELTYAAVGAMIGAAIVNAPVTMDRKEKKKSWAELTRRDEPKVEVNAGMDIRVVSCQLPVSIKLDGEWYWKDRSNYK